jgi:hypothetical protein
MTPEEAYNHGRYSSDSTPPANLHGLAYSRWQDGRQAAARNQKQAEHLAGSIAKLLPGERAAEAVMGIPWWIRVPLAGLLAGVIVSAGAKTASDKFLLGGMGFSVIFTLYLLVKAIPDNRHVMYEWLARRFPWVARFNAAMNESPGAGWLRIKVGLLLFFPLFIAFLGYPIAKAVVADPKGFWEVFDPATRARKKIEMERLIRENDSTDVVRKAEAEQENKVLNRQYRAWKHRQQAKARHKRRKHHA